MINLKLVEYKDGKFEKFLELGKDFMYAGDSVIICGGSVEELIKCVNPIFNNNYFKKDKKDPLNRFDGLFDGRTYGEGRFVLIKAMDFEGAIFWLDYIYETCGKYSILKYDNYLNEFVFSHSLKGCFKSPAIFCCGISEIIETVGAEYIGNLHKSPELLKKI